MSAQLVRVSFYDDTLEATLTDDGRVLVQLRRPCAALGLDFASQLARLNDPDRSPWATVVKMTMVAEDQKVRQLTCIDLDTLTMWLATITTGKVREDLRPKVLRYQKECARVLREHFFGPATTGDALLDSIQTIHRTAGALVAIRQRQLLTEREIASVRTIAEGADAKAERAGATATAALCQAENNHGYYQVLGWARLFGREMTEAQASGHGRRLTAYCEINGYEVRQQRHARYGTVNLYPESALRQHFDDWGDPS